MAEICTISASYRLEGEMDTPAAKREPSYTSPSNDQPTWARVFRKVLDSKAQPVETDANPAAS